MAQDDEETIRLKCARNRAIRQRNEIPLISQYIRAPHFGSTPKEVRPELEKFMFALNAAWYCKLQGMPWAAYLTHLSRMPLIR